MKRGISITRISGRRLRNGWKAGGVISSNPNRQYVWGERYIDDLMLRDRDTTGDGTLDERLYALQDANWNMVAVIDTTGDVQERYAYQAYGSTAFLAPDYAARTNSSFAWETYSQRIAGMQSQDSTLCDGGGSRL